MMKYLTMTKHFRQVLLPTMPHLVEAGGIALMPQAV